MNKCSEINILILWALAFCIRFLRRTQYKIRERWERFIGIRSFIKYDTTSAICALSFFPLQYTLLRVAERPITEKESEQSCDSKPILTAPRVLISFINWMLNCSASYKVQPHIPLNKLKAQFWISLSQPEKPPVLPYIVIHRENAPISRYKADKNWHASEAAISW